MEFLLNRSFFRIRRLPPCLKLSVMLVLLLSRILSICYFCFVFFLMTPSLLQGLLTVSKFLLCLRPSTKHIESTKALCRDYVQDEWAAKEHYPQKTGCGPHSVVGVSLLAAGVVSWVLCLFCGPSLALFAISSSCLHIEPDYD
jgi:hypothetical protein